MKNIMTGAILLMPIVVTNAAPEFVGTKEKVEALELYFSTTPEKTVVLLLSLIILILIAILVMLIFYYIERRKHMKHEREMFEHYKRNRP